MCCSSGTLHALHSKMIMSYYSYVYRRSTYYFLTPFYFLMKVSDYLNMVERKLLLLVTTERVERDHGRMGGFTNSTRNKTCELTQNGFISIAASSIRYSSFRLLP